MAFVQKTWKDRVAEYINRRILTKEDGTTELVSVERSEGTISQEGDAFSAENMNDLEQRIANEFSEQNKNIESFTKPIILLEDSLSRSSGIFNIAGKLSDYKEIVIIVCSNNNGANTTAYTILVDALKNMITDANGWFLSHIGEREYAYVKYSDETSINFPIVQGVIMRAVYGLK